MTTTTPPVSPENSRGPDVAALRSDPHAPVERLRLDTHWSPCPDMEHGRLEMQLINLGAFVLEGFVLAYTCLRAVETDPEARNATLLRRDAYLHEVMPPEGMCLEPGAIWHFSLGGLGGAPRHRSEGVASAYLNLRDGRRLDVEVGDLRRETAGQPGEDEPLIGGTYAMLPWPREIEVTPGRWKRGAALVPETASALPDIHATADMDSLFHRLFPLEPRPFSLFALPQDRRLRFEAAPDLLASEYRLDFLSDLVVLRYADQAARRFGLVTLAQLLRGACAGGEFRFPESGFIADRPRFSWRGCHVDTARRFYPPADLARLIDILAYLRMNIFHWHLTDDEAWRLEIAGLPELTAIGGRRHPDGPLRPQLGDGAAGSEGIYRRGDIAALLAHAESLGVEIVPEIDVPGHCTAALLALPALADSDETASAYVSAQGFFNNALNPASPETDPFLEQVFDAVVDLFPSVRLHVGGDEVPADAWATSPLARASMAEQGLESAAELQADLMRRVQVMLRRRGRVMIGWDEIANGGGTDPQDAILMVWRSAANAGDLAARGHDLVLTPAQAYYLDIARSDDWDEPGASWAGSTPLHRTYTFEVDDAVPETHRHRVLGVQACIWSELVHSRAHFNHLVFPRLAAIAEAAWTPATAKNWERFQRLTWLCPHL